MNAEEIEEANQKIRDLAHALRWIEVGRGVSATSLSFEIDSVFWRISWAEFAGHWRLTATRYDQIARMPLENAPAAVRIAGGSLSWRHGGCGQPWAHRSVPAGRRHAPIPIGFRDGAVLLPVPV